jgi:hypothetical protein
MTIKKVLLVFTGAVAAAVVALVPGGAAVAAGQIPAFAFDDCPAIPAGVDKAQWRCEEMHASGSIQLGAVKLPVTLKTTHAEGRRPGASTTEFIFGALRADPVPVPGGLLNSRLDRKHPVLPANLNLEYAGHIDFVAGPPMAEILHLKYRVGNRLVGDNCYIGTDNQPLVIVGAIVGDRVPVQDDPQVLKFAVEDDGFAVPAAQGCGPLNRLVDHRFGLPSTGTLNLAVYFSIKTYDKL